MCFAISKEVTAHQSTSREVRVSAGSILDVLPVQAKYGKSPQKAANRVRVGETYCHRNNSSSATKNINCSFASHWTLKNCEDCCILDRFQLTYISSSSLEKLHIDWNWPIENQRTGSERGRYRERRLDRTFSYAPTGRVRTPDANATCPFASIS